MIEFADNPDDDERKPRNRPQLARHKVEERLKKEEASYGRSLPILSSGTRRRVALVPDLLRQWQSSKIFVCERIVRCDPHKLGHRHDNLPHVLTGVPGRALQDFM